MAANATNIANQALTKLGTEQILSISSVTSKEASHARLHYDAARNQVLRDHQWNFANRTQELALAAPALTVDIQAKSPASTVFQTYTATTGTFISGDYAFSLADVIPESGGTLTERWCWLNDGVIVAFANEAATHPFQVVDWIANDGTFATISTIQFCVPERGRWAYAYVLPADHLRTMFLELGPCDQDSRNGIDLRIDKFARGTVFGLQCLLTNVKPTVLLTYTAVITDTTQFDSLFEEAFVTLLAAKMARAITGSDAAEANLMSVYHGTVLPQARFRDAQETASHENRTTLSEYFQGDLLTRRTVGDDY